MKWFTRPLIFLGMALILCAAFLGLNQAGAFTSFEMQGPPPAQVQTVNIQNATQGALSTGAQAAPATSTAANRQAPAGSPPQGHPQHKGGLNWAELAKNLGMVLAAWVALTIWDRVSSRLRKVQPRTPTTHGNIH